jgi:hypothetical protein
MFVARGFSNSYDKFLMLTRKIITKTDIGW